MTVANDWRVYTQKPRSDAEFTPWVPSVTLRAGIDDPRGYLPDVGLVDAVNVALALGHPLLVTGEPGTGKTQLGASIAHQLRLGTPLFFHTKTTSTARHLFYRYDALRHFQDANLRRETSAPVDVNETFRKYIEFQALGLAIMLGMPRDDVARWLPAEYADTPRTRSVIVIDEVDKAPRDLPNDVLYEIEHLAFTVNETGKSFVSTPEWRPIVVLTSNSEKLLPDAFLRRCVFYHLPFPDHDHLRDIVATRLGRERIEGQHWIGDAIARFEAIRELPLKKKPATAELLSWLQILERVGRESGGNPVRGNLPPESLTVLAKNKDDLKILRDQRSP